MSTNHHQDEPGGTKLPKRDVAKFARKEQTVSDFFREMEQAKREDEAEVKRQRTETQQQEKARRKHLLDMERGFTDEEKDVAALVAAVQALIVPELRRRENDRSGYPYDVLNKAKEASLEHFNVYAILLSRLSLEEKSGYAPGKPGMPCIYVGQTWHDPEHRFDQHKGLIPGRPSRYVRRWGLSLLPEVFAPYNPMPEQLSKKTETALAEALFLMGCTIFGGR